MTFVPVIVPPHEASPTAVELGRRLSETIDAFSREHTGTSAEDVRDALRIAASRGAAGISARAAAPILAAAVAIAGLLAYFLLARPEPGGAQGAPMAIPYVAVAAILVSLAVVLLRRRR